MLCFYQAVIPFVVGLKSNLCENNVTQIRFSLGSDTIIHSSWQYTEAVNKIKEKSTNKKWVHALISQNTTYYHFCLFQLTRKVHDNTILNNAMTIKAKKYYTYSATICENVRQCDRKAPDIDTIRFLDKDLVWCHYNAVRFSQILTIDTVQEFC